MIINCVCVQTTPEEQLPYSTARCIVMVFNCVCVQTHPTACFLTHNYYSTARCIVVMVVTVSVCRHSLRLASLHKLQYGTVYCCHGCCCSELYLCADTPYCQLPYTLQYVTVHCCHGCYCICVQTLPTVSFLTQITVPSARCIVVMVVTELYLCADTPYGSLPYTNYSTARCIVVMVVTELYLCADTPYGQLPYLVYNGKTYGQSDAIAAFFAKQFG